MTSLLDFFQAIDQQLLLFLNVKFANALFDLIMPFITEKQNWYVPIGIIGILLFWKGGAKGKFVVLTLVVSLIISDQTSSSLVKPMVGRLRPCKTLENFRLLVECGGGYSFPSSHAVNIATAMGIFIYNYRRFSATWIIIALLVGYSRIYVGVHYPFDVLGGFVLGSGIAWIIIIISGRIRARFEKLNKCSPPT
jgi:undecaprenyl-diphosphatase